MKDEKESHDDAHWRALAESLKGDDEPPRQAEVIRAQFRRKPAVEKDVRTPDKGTQTSGRARRPATERPGDETQSVDGQPVDAMSRPELIAYLRSALATLEQNPAAPNSAEPDPAQADQPPSAAKQISHGGRAALPGSNAPNEPPSAIATSEPQARSDLFGGGEEGATPADGIVARGTRLPYGDEQQSPPDIPSGSTERTPAPDTSAGNRNPNDRDATGGSLSPIPAPKQRLQFSQEVPDFLRSRDISWPGATDPARKGAVVPNRMAARPGRLETLYPGQIPDPREAPPPWVKNQNAQTRSKRRSRLVSISVAVAAILMLSLGATWVLTQSEASARVLVAESIRSWLNRAGSATATGVRQTGSVIQALLPFGDDKPAIQSIVLLPQSGQQPSVQIPTPDPSPTVSAAQIEADPRAATELPPIASQTALAEADPPEALALTITPTSNAVAGSQPIYDTPEAITRPTETLDIVAADKSAGLTELVPAPAGTQEGPLPEQIETEIVVQRDLVLLPRLPDQRRAVGQPRAAVIDTPVAPPPAVLQPGTEVPVAEIPRNPPPVVASSNLPAPPLESWRVQLASLADGERAQAEWQRLLQIHPALLASQPLHIERVELDRGAFHRIQVGNFDSVAAAQDLCNGLKARGQDCLVVR